MQCKYLDIKFDLDGCFVNFAEHVKETAWNQYRTEIIVGPDFQFGTRPKISKNDLFAIFDRVYTSPEHTPVYAGAQGLCDELWELARAPVHFITKRPVWTASFTAALIKRFCNVPFTVGYADSHSKSVFMGRARHFVEDRRKICLELADMGYRILMPARVYNGLKEPHPNIERIQGISQLISRARDFVASLDPPAEKRSRIEMLRIRQLN